uniref:Uncharacterized protein n=1 Tax=Rhizophora mucronata TaxID=61149 RepID=A0A2P2PAL7_RHIMU
MRCGIRVDHSQKPHLSCPTRHGKVSPFISCLLWC